MGPMVGMIFPLVGQPGHGRTAFVRRQPVRIVDGRFEGGYTGVFELICPGCGDNPYVDYSEVLPRLQLLRGPRTLQAALEAYDEHLGPCPGPHGGSAGRRGSPRAVRARTPPVGPLGRPAAAPGSRRTPDGWRAGAWSAARPRPGRRSPSSRTAGPRR